MKKQPYIREETPRKCGICRNPIECLKEVSKDEDGQVVERILCYRCSACKVQYQYMKEDWR